MCVGVSEWLSWSGIRVAGFSLQHGYKSNTHRTKHNTTNVVIQQNSRKLLMMDILMSKTCWAHKKRNKIASDIKLVFYSSNIVVFDDIYTYYIDPVISITQQGLCTSKKNWSGIKPWYQYGLHVSETETTVLWKNVFIVTLDKIRGSYVWWSLPLCTFETVLEARRVLWIDSSPYQRRMFE